MQSIYDALTLVFVLVLLGYIVMQYGSDKVVLIPIITGLLGFLGGRASKK